MFPFIRAPPKSKQHNSEPTHPNALPIPNPLFAPNLPAPILSDCCLQHFSKNTNQVHKIVCSVAPPVPNIPNIPLGHYFVPNMSQWRFPQHRPSIVNQDTTTVNSAPPNVQAHIAHSNTKVPLRIYQNSPVLINMQSPSGAQ